MQKDDVISRQYAIEHYQHVCRRINCKECPLHIQVTNTLTDCELELFLHNLPSAQSEVAKDTNVPSNDCISRQAAIDALEWKWAGKAAIDAIKDLPSAQPDLSDYSDKLWKAAYERGKAETEQRWIPCSERLPDSMGWDQQYLVSLVWGGVGTMEYKSTGFHNYGSFQPVPIEIVTAWMPLPEPYKAERREDE